MKQIAGIDVGFRYTVAATDGVVKTFPSVVAPTSGGIKLDLMNQATTVEYAGVRYYVGDQAAKRAGIAQRTIDHTRTGSEEYFLLFLTAVAGLFPEGGSVYVVTGLPMSEMHNADKVATALSRTHTIRMDGRPVRLTLHVKVIPQPLGTLTRETFAVDGRTLRVKNQALTEGSTLVIDWGGLTDGYQKFSGRDLIEEQSASSDTGMVRVLNQIIAYAAKEHDLRLSLDEADAALRSGLIPTNNGPISVNDFVAEALEAKAKACASVAKTLWGDGRKDTTMLMTGGGAHHLPQLFKRFYPHGNAVTVRNPHLANAEGFFVYALGLEAGKKWKSE